MHYVVGTGRYKRIMFENANGYTSEHSFNGAADWVSNGIITERVKCVEVKRQEEDVAIGLPSLVLFYDVNSLPSRLQPSVGLTCAPSCHPSLSLEPAHEIPVFDPEPPSPNLSRSNDGPVPEPIPYRDRAAAMGTGKVSMSQHLDRNWTASGKGLSCVTCACSPSALSVCLFLVE
ncbi:hypothetical protein C8Q76DRAFT_695313 [Earliella scabrosa]|nr:hypothetical protein C8Q76DRAFT_695313 [Earliella scabrosa]